ncbi:MAG: ABC transporter substrate-binding protein, partial [Mycobacterium leprae]
TPRTAAPTGTDPVADGYLRSVVSIAVRGEQGDRSGSGFVMDASGHVVTAAHVVEGSVGCATVYDNNGKAHQGTLVDRDVNRDVALLWVPTLAAWPDRLTLGQSAGVKPGDDLYVLGSPKGSGSSKPLVAQVSKLAVNQSISGRYLANLIQFSGATVLDGTSGGPLVQKSSGKVIGIVTAAANDPTAWAIPTDDVTGLLTGWATRTVASCTAGTAAKTVPALLATITPLSVTHGIEGQDLVDGAQLALRDMDSELKSVGYAVTLQKYDDQGVADKAREKASMAAYDPKVIGVVGSLDSQATYAIGQSLAGTGLVMVAPVAGDDKLTAQGWTNFNRLVAANRRQEQTAAKFAQSTLKAKAVFLVSEATAEGKTSAAAFEEAAQVIGLSVVGQFQLTPDWSYATLKAAMIAANTDSIYYAGGADAALKLVQSMRQDGLLLPVIGTQALVDPRFGELTGPGARGIYFTRLTAEPTAQFQRHFETEMAKPTRGYAAYGYDAARLILSALVRYGQQHPAQLPTRAELARLVRATTGYSGWSSWVTFDPVGENLSSWVHVLEWKQGSIQPMVSLR